MTTAIAQHAQDVEHVLLDLYALLRELDTYRGLWCEIPPRLAALQSRLEALPLPDRSPEELAQQVDALVALLRDGTPKGDTSPRAQRVAWRAYRIQLQLCYDTLCGALKRHGVALPLHRPNNYSRNVMHVVTALICLLLVEHVLSPTGMILTAGIGALCCWSLETGRIFSRRLNEFLLWAMSSVAHPHERRHVNSATWYTTALLILALLFTPKVCAVALAVLGLADPAAGLVGRRWGRIKMVNGRSLEGSMTFVVVGTLAALVALSIWHPEVQLGLALVIALGAAIPAAVTELFSRRVDDNFSIPLAAACGAWAVSLAF